MVGKMVVVWMMSFYKIKNNCYVDNKLEKELLILWYKIKLLY
jgi:hypothetical protein